MTRTTPQVPASSGSRPESVSEVAAEPAVPAASEPASPGTAGTDTPEAGPRTPAALGTEPAPEEAGGSASTSGAAGDSAATTPKTPAEGQAAAPQAGTAGAGVRAGTAETPSQAGSADPDLPRSEPEPESESGSRAEPEPDAAAAAQSRLPGLVRTMTTTAIGQPQQQSGPVGRPGKAVLAGAAVAGALLVSVPFLVLAGNDDDGPGKQSVAAAGTVLDGSGQEAPGDFAVTPPESGAPDEDKQKAGKADAPDKPVHHAPPSAEDTDDDPPKKAAGSGSRPKSEPKKPSGEKQSGETKQSGGAKSGPAKAPAVTFSGPVSFRSHLSGRCIDVPNHDFSDGKALHVWDCNNAPAQKWRFASDGTIRIQDKCLDVANANFSDGTPIQIAWCNGNAAQRFALNGSHDLVNTVVGMCVDIAGANRNSGAALQLLKCSGNDAQKWST